MILIDTTVLVYATGTEHPLRAPSRNLLARVQEGALRASTTIEVIQELAHVRSRRTSRTEAASVARAFAAGLGPLVQVDEDDLVEGLSLYARDQSLGAFDAVLAATALRRGWTLGSADRAFRAVPGLVYLDPGSPSFEQDLATMG